MMNQGMACGKRVRYLILGRTVGHQGSSRGERARTIIIHQSGKTVHNLHVPSKKKMQHAQAVEDIIHASRTLPSAYSRSLPSLVSASKHDRHPVHEPNPSTSFSTFCFSWPSFHLTGCMDNVVTCILHWDMSGQQCAGKVGQCSISGIPAGPAALHHADIAQVFS